MKFRAVRLLIGALLTARTVLFLMLVDPGALRASSTTRSLGSFLFMLGLWGLTPLTALAILTLPPFKSFERRIALPLAATALLFGVCDIAFLVHLRWFPRSSTEALILLWLPLWGLLAIPVTLAAAVSLQAIARKLKRVEHG